MLTQSLHSRNAQSADVETGTRSTLSYRGNGMGVNLRGDEKTFCAVNNGFSMSVFHFA